MDWDLQYINCLLFKIDFESELWLQVMIYYKSCFTHIKHLITLTGIYSILFLTITNDCQNETKTSRKLNVMNCLIKQMMNVVQLHYFWCIFVQTWRTYDINWAFKNTTVTTFTWNIILTWTYGRHFCLLGKLKRS